MFLKISDKVMSTSSTATPTPHYNDPDHNVIKLKYENHEKFCALIISHLTRFLDLAGDQLDVLRGNHDAILKDNVNKSHGGGLKLWNPLKKKDPKHTGCLLSNSNLMQIQQLTDFLGNHLSMEGLFRKPGNSVRQGQLQTALGTGAIINFEKSQFQAHDAASVLKGILGELSEPLLLPSQHFDAHIQIANMTKFDEAAKKSVPDKGKRIQALQLLLLLLPTNHRKVLRGIFDLLLQTAKNQKVNKMNAANLATVFTPRLIWPRAAKASDIHGGISNLNDHIAFMIRHSEKIFCAPPYIRQAANLYFPLDVTASPKVSAATLVAPSSAIKRTASERQKYQDSTKKQTETAMTELFNQVTNLPDSSKKKKFVKNFSKHQEVIKYQSKHHKRHRTLSGFLRKKSVVAAKEAQARLSPQGNNLSLIDLKKNRIAARDLNADSVSVLSDSSLNPILKSDGRLPEHLSKNSLKITSKSPLVASISKLIQSKQSSSTELPSKRESTEVNSLKVSEV